MATRRLIWQLFPEPTSELPTFNSNAVLSVIHRLPGLGRWFLYSDDDMVSVIVVTLVIVSYSFGHGPLVPLQR